jgi:shikimate dehydrogenase
MRIDGATRMVVIVGDPIAQVKSPSGMTAMLQQAGRNAVVMPAHVASDRLGVFLAGVALARNLDGVIATIPHKFACYRHCATATPRAHALGAVNIMRRNPDGGWHGEMLDGLGFVAAIRANGGEPRGQAALLVGAGGAGSAIALALLEAGVTRLDIHDSDAARRDALLERMTALHPGRLGIGSPDPHGYGLVANATPAGMQPGDPPPVDTGRLDPSCFAACVITAPPVPPWIEAARARGCRTSLGVDMFAAQQGLMRDFLADQDA